MTGALHLLLLLFLSMWDLSATQNFPPSFSSNVESINIPEQQEANDTLEIYDVDATDPDGDDIAYVIQANVHDAYLFRVEEDTGKIFTRPGVVLDREQLSPTNTPLDLLVEARDGFHDDYPAFHLLIVLQDENDNDPIIASSFPPSITFPEDTLPGTVLLEVEASDADAGANAYLSFSLTQSSSLFSLESDTGELRLSGQLDFDNPSNRQHFITIIVEDYGDPSRRDSESLRVFVTDVDDLNPVFELSSYDVSIFENSTFGDSVVTVIARDGDTGVDAEIFYSLETTGNSLIDGELSFAIDEVTGEIAVNVTSLDRETHSSYSLTVQAAQVNNTNRTATVTVEVTVLDINDNVPVFDPSNYSHNVSEMEDVGEELFTVTVTDNDEGANADFDLQLEDLLNRTAPLPFSVSGDGVISLSSSLNFEETEYYLFNVRAVEEDGGNGSALVRVNVENVNDVTPSFQPVTYNESIRENVTADAFIAQITAFDGDKGIFGEITYSISTGHFDDFYINTTGAVFTNKPLDYEDRESYTIIIAATDIGNRVASPPAVLTVEVLNINDNPPKFERDNFTVQLQEETDEGTSVATLIVTDMDGEDFTDLTFSITAGNDFGQFTLDEFENVVVTAARLDYDDEMSGIREQTLTISVNDTLFTDEMTLVIQLQDINDNSPAFLNDSYHFEVFEDVSVPSEVGEVAASDADSGMLGEVLYSISDNDQFTINATTGRISTKSDLDREDASSFTVTVTAIDQDPIVAAQRSQAVQVSIAVLDVNDNFPLFSSDNYEFSVAENTDTLTFSVSATDKDDGTNADITYQFIDGNTNNSFLIDHVTGEITRNPSVTLDREEVASYLITVLASDSGDPPRNTTATIAISITDVNDKEPVFNPASQDASINEDIREGTFVLRITATDADTLPNSMLQYSLTVAGPTEPDPASTEPAPPSGTFVIDSELGDITTQGTFDREAFVGPYVLQIVATDNGVGVSLSGTAEVTVYLTDVNDNDPIFLPSTYSMTLAEQLPAGQSVARVSATDRDEGSNKELSYSISSIIALNNIEDQSIVSSHFSVNSTTGVVLTATELDFEFVERYRVTVAATDQGDSQRSSSATITVTVTDVNDHTPQFSSSSYSLVLSEGTLRNTRFSLLEVTDQDSGDNSRLTFSADISPPLSVDSETGELVVVQTLDYESKSSYSFTVNVTDNGVAPNMNSTEVTVLLEDVNDNPPLFENATYSVTIPEANSSSAYEILTVKADDRDSDEFGTVSYSLLPGASSLFSLDNTTRVLLVVGDVDFESLDPPLGASEVVLSLTVQASDGGVPAMTATADIFVTVTDENDNSPVFQGTPYAASVRENSAAGVEVIAVQATDRDGNANGVLKYSIEETEDFSIDAVTGIITTGTSNASTIAVLYDYENGPREYTLRVYATDNGTDQKTTETVVAIEILDTNDNSPVIVSVVDQSVSVSEGADPEDRIGTVITVNDRDSGENGQFDYTLSNDGGLFAVDPTTGEVYLVGYLDRETEEDYNITITVTDRGQPRMSAESYLLVTVRDVNDNAPTFDQDVYTVVVPENVAHGSAVAILRVQDLDSPDNAAGTLTFTITNTPQPFTLAVRSRTGNRWEVDVETVGNVFDYESEPRSYLLTIEARDGSTPVMVATANLTVTLLDENDEPPSFSPSNSYTFSMPENLPAGGAVGSLLATDPDGANNGIVMYNFASGTAALVQAIFSLNPDTGILTLRTPINFENSSMFYEFSVVASDGGSPARSSTASVRVNIEDINEFAPVFTRDLYNATVNENEPERVALTVIANDDEVSGSITYSIVTGSTDDFMLDPDSGVIRTLGPLNRELVPQYIFTVQAVDEEGVDGRTSYAQVSITVGDENDVTPSFPLESYTYRIPESSIPSFVLSPMATATDADLGSNAAIRYFLQASSSPGHPFRVDENSGVVTQEGTLDREVTQSYTLVLQAEDGGTPSRTGTTQLRILVTDVNDQPPVFEQSSYSATIPENSPEGVYVADVIATDQDTTDTHSYSIIRGDPLDQFHIDPLSGLITTTTISLDREVESEYRLTVSATDSFSRSDEAEVVVSVEDLNDNSPLFSQETYSVTHDEYNDFQLVVAEVSASDIDEGSNGEVRYQITGGNSNEVFRIDPASGQVVALVRSLNYESTPVHTLTIEATDQATPESLQRFSTAVVTVVLRDVNDNRPVFSQSTYRASISENTALGTTVAIISATDGDSGTNGEVTYRLGVPSGLFAINSTTGVVTVVGNINFEMGQEHDLTVEASDHGNPRRGNVASLLITVINAEDESPRFPISFYTASVDEDAASSTQVLTVTATDPDGSDSLVYDIIQSSSSAGSSFFRIDPATGDISTAGTLDRETVAVVDLQVIATDSAELNGTAIVQITIGDVNDNAPKFTANSYTASLRENSAVGTTIIPFSGGNSTRVEASDADGPGLNSEISYDKEGDDADKFSVDKDTGIVTVAAGAVLDREEDDTLELVITAEDHGSPERTTRVTMTISLLDENDNTPVFIPQFGYAVIVPEDTTVSSLLTTAEATDPDLLAGGEVTFRADTSSPLSKFSCFSINSTTGEITLASSLDREQDPLISLVISAHDSGMPSLVASTTVQITVTDVNDNQPVFSRQTYIAAVSEQHTVGASIITVSADDPDSGTNGQVEYRVDNSLFSINSDTGEVSTQLPLDYETQRSHDLLVQACDQGPETNCSTASVMVYVTDFNDEFPTFDFEMYRTDICHSQLVDEVFVQPVAIDRDSGANSQLTYSLQDANELMSIWPDSGRIFLQRALQLDEVGSEFTAVVKATDGGNPMLSGTATVLVQVLNCTEETFRFIIPFFEAATLEEITGTDVLLNPNNSPSEGLETTPVMAHSLVFSPELTDNPFGIAGNRLLTIEEPSQLDRETRDLYTLPVRAISTMGSTAYATVTVAVEDANDNEPLLQLPALSFTVPENTSAPLYITTAVATDDDIGTNAEIEFSFPLSNDFFSINETTGVITTVTELDREDIDEHQLIIQASDGEFSDTATIIVAVSDVNDNPPVFSDDSYIVEVAENRPAGTHVLTVEATDADVGEYATISFFIVGGDIHLFSLNSETGVVRTTTELNFETNRHHSLTIRASDGGAPILSNTVEVNITVLDINDHTPMFLNPLLSTRIPESSPPGTVLTDFNVTDSDSGDLGVQGVRFSIVAGNTILFSVNPVSGILKTEALLDRDVGPACQFLSIQASDSAGENTLSNVTEIEVCLIDQNDNCPNFTQPSFSGQIPENQPTDQQLLLRVQATDADSDTSTNGAVMYRLLEDGEVFDIDPSTGFLSLTSTLDTEAIPRYELVVESCDRGEEPCCTNTTITIDVLDVNDNRPVISNVNTDSCIEVLETNNTYSCLGSAQEVGDVVFTANATDADSGLGGAILFELVGSYPSFSISSSGVLTIAGQLDYETQDTYQLYINALDQGQPLSLTSETRILCITVEDINDRAPSFPVSQYETVQDEGTVPEAAIIHVVANDADDGENAAVTYSIASGNTSIFSIDQETGQLFLLEELDCETTTSYSLTITANNSLSVCPLSSSVDILVTVGDVNDNPPILSQESYNTTIPENSLIATPILSISATDADKTPPNNELQYRLVLGSGSNPFHLDQDGVLSVQNSLNAESRLEYSFAVEVRDSGDIVMTDTATIRIILEDVNDEPPIFSLESFFVIVSEGDDTPSSLLPLQFSDPDVQPENRDSIITITAVTGHQTLTNNLVNLRGSDIFSVSENNTLELHEDLDREQFSSYDIRLDIANTALCGRTDGGECSSSAVVEVAVTDINDNSPQFTSDTYSGEVSVTASVGTSVLTVEATDTDSGNFQEVRYSIVDSLNGRFRIDEETGVVLTRGSFDNLDGQTLTLKVLASDNPGSSPSLTSTATVSLVVLNDFQRISVLFSCGVETILQSENDIIRTIANVSGLDIQVENYVDHSDDIRSNFIFHATDPDTNAIIDFDEFFKRLTEGTGDREAELITQLNTICTVEKITAFANIDDYEYPNALDTQTIVIFILCVILATGAISTLVLSIRQRWVALHDTRSKLLADVFYGSPGSTSLVENVHHENFQLEQMETKRGNQQNPMFVQPYDNWQGIDGSGPGSTGDISSMNRDNPLYESQEIRMEMFADVSDEEGDEADDAELLAAALQEDEEPEDNSVTAI